MNCGRADGPLRRARPSDEDAPVTGRWARRTVVASGVLSVVLGLAPAAVAQTATPTASPAGAPSTSSSPSASPTFQTPQIDGAVTGSNIQGKVLEIQVDSTLPGGWEGLHRVDVALLVGGREVDQIDYDIENAKVTLDGHAIAVGTGAEASGAYLHLNGARVILTTGGGALSLRVGADVIQAIPESARFRLSVTTDRGQTASVVRELASPPAKGLTWSTVIAALVIALLAGGFVGNVFASRRRPPARLSIYGTVQRRLDDERSGRAKR